MRRVHLQGGPKDGEVLIVRAPMDRLEVAIMGEIDMTDLTAEIPVHKGYYASSSWCPRIWIWHPPEEGG